LWDRPKISKKSTTGVSPLFVERLRFVVAVEFEGGCLAKEELFKRKRASPECENGDKKEEEEKDDDDDDIVLEILLAASIECRLCDVTRRMFLPVVPVRNDRDEERIPAIRCFMVVE
jgi:hypothetical protein